MNWRKFKKYIFSSIFLALIIYICDTFAVVSLQLRFLLPQPKTNEFHLVKQQKSLTQMSVSSSCCKMSFDQFCVDATDIKLNFGNRIFRRDTILSVDKISVFRRRKKKKKKSNVMECHWHILEILLPPRSFTRICCSNNDHRYITYASFQWAGH